MYFLKSFVYSSNGNSFPTIWKRSSICFKISKDTSVDKYTDNLFKKFSNHLEEIFLKDLSIFYEILQKKILFHLFGRDLPKRYFSKYFCILIISFKKVAEIEDSNDDDVESDKIFIWYSSNKDSFPSIWKIKKQYEDFSSLYIYNHLFEELFLKKNFF